VTAEELSPDIAGGSNSADLLVPGDWSGTVTETKATLERITLSFMTRVIDEPSVNYAGGWDSHYAIVKTNTHVPVLSAHDLNSTAEFPAFFGQCDEVIRWGHLQWANVTGVGTTFPFQWNRNVEDQVLNIRARRRLEGDTAIRLFIGSYSQQATEIPLCHVFTRSLVRIGLR